MNRHLIIVIVLAVASTAFLFALPKVVVKDASQRESSNQSSANRDAPQKQPEQQTSTNETHAIKLSAEQQKQVDALRKQLLTGKDKTAKVKVLAQISMVFGQANRLDSAAYYSEQIALLNPSQQTWIQAGDAYTQAANLSLKPEVAEVLAGKARAAYQKVLDENPHNLKAKTNMAMTWVSSQTPMQGIILLREVLNEEPNYEPALMSLGMLSMQSGQFSKGIDRFKQILKINPKNTLAQFYLGLSLIEAKENIEAKKVLEDLLTKENDPAIIEEAKKALESLH